VEGISWVNQCVESGVYENTPVAKKNLGGRIPGNKSAASFISLRSPPTNCVTDEPNLLPKTTAIWRCTLHAVFQTRACGVERETNSILTYALECVWYSETFRVLCDLFIQFELYPWAERHPWQSWRERYKNNSARFSKLIASYLDQHPIPENGKGLHGFVRVSSPLKSQSKQSNAVQPESPSKEGIQGPCMDNIDDTDEERGSQWSIKVGRQSTPAWGKGKRKADYDNPEETIKRHKIQ
jgi:hypothetical protein